MRKYKIYIKALLFDIGSSKRDKQITIKFTIFQYTFVQHGDTGSYVIYAPGGPHGLPFSGSRNIKLLDLVQ